MAVKVQIIQIVSLSSDLKEINLRETISGNTLTEIVGIYIIKFKSIYNTLEF